MTDSGSGRGWLTFATLALPCFALFATLAFKDSLLGINSDAAVYLLLAEHWSPWRGGTVAFANELARVYPYPPVYPLVLSLLGGGASAPAVSYLAGAGILALAMVLIARWLRDQGVSRSLAAGIVLLFALTPSTIFVVFGIFSEPLYLALAFAGLLLLNDAPTPRETSRAQWLAAAGVIGIASITRSVGVSLVAASLVFWWCRTGARRHRFVPVVLILPFAGWSLFKRLGGGEPGYVASIAGDGVGSMLLATLRQLPVNAHATWEYLHRSFDLLGNAYSAAVLVVVLLPALALFQHELRRCRVAALYLAAYLAVLLLWPYPNHLRRFLFPVLPLVLFYAVQGPGWLLRNTAFAGYGRKAGVLALALLLLATVPSSLSIALQIAQYRDTAIAHYPKTAQFYGRDSQAEAIANVRLTERIFGFMARAGAHVPPGACVTSVMPEFVHLYMRRLGRRPAGEADSDAELRSDLAACPYVLMFHVTMFPTLGDSQYYPLQRAPDELAVIYHEPVDPGDEHGQRMLLARYTPKQAAP